MAWVGSEGAADALSADVTVDLDDAWVAPAFVDAHVHATSTGLALTGLDLTGAPSLAVALDRVAQAARAARGGVVLGTGWDDTGWPEGRPPTAAELDRASYGGVVYLARTDVHSAVASSALLAAAPEARAAAGLRGGRAGPAGGPPRRAAGRVRRRHARRSGGRPRRATLDRAAALGIACVHECGGPDIGGEDDFRAAAGAGARRSERARLLGRARRRRAGPRARRGRRRRRPVRRRRARQPHRLPARAVRRRRRPAATPTSTPTQVARHVAACTRAGLQAGFHAIGDAALDGGRSTGIAAAAEEVGPDARAGRPPPGRARRDADARRTIAHDGRASAWSPACSRPSTPAGAARTACTSPASAPSGPAAMNPFAALAAAGVALALGSDAPVTPLDPWGTVRAAVRHRTPGSGLSARAAFSAHTRGGWRAARRRRRRRAGARARRRPSRSGSCRASSSCRRPDERVVGLVDRPAGGRRRAARPLDGPDPVCRRTVVRRTARHRHVADRRLTPERRLSAAPPLTCGDSAEPQVRGRLTAQGPAAASSRPRSTRGRAPGATARQRRPGGLQLPGQRRSEGSVGRPVPGRGPVVRARRAAPPSAGRHWVGRWSTPTAVRERAPAPPGRRRPQPRRPRTDLPLRLLAAARLAGCCSTWPSRRSTPPWLAVPAVAVLALACRGASVRGRRAARASCTGSRSSCRWSSGPATIAGPARAGWRWRVLQAAFLALLGAALPLRDPAARLAAVDGRAVGRCRRRCATGCRSAASPGAGWPSARATAR